MLHRARCPAAAARRVALPGRQARHASSSAEGAPGLPLRAWARAGASLQLCAGVVLGGTVLYQAGQQAALERKLHLVGESHIGVSIHIQCRRSGVQRYLPRWPAATLLVPAPPPILASSALCRLRALRTPRLNCSNVILSVSTA